MEIEYLFDDTIFIHKSNSITIKKDIYNRNNWQYFPKDSKPHDECVMRFIITNKDL